MISHLRRKLIWITMALMMAMLLVIFGLVYHFTRADLEDGTVRALRAAAEQQLRPGVPGSLEPESAVPCFTLEMGPHGDLIAVGSESFDLTDGQMLARIYLQAQAGGGQTGILEDYSLRFYRADSPMGQRYAFTDISAQRQTLTRLLKNFAVIGLVSFFGFLGISILLAHWAVGPVEQAWKQQRQFVADASHELKTPLTVILTNAELLQSPEYGEADKGRFAESVLTMSRQMRALVENLLELARADNGQVAAECCHLDYSRLVEESVLPFEPVYFEQGLVLDARIQPGLHATGSDRYLRQVVEILLDNGRKYALPGSTVELSLVRQSRGRSLLSVSSRGQTLTQQQCSDIFKRFYRVDSARSRDGSFGLGLAIAQRIVSEHRGRIWAQGRDGVNTFFVSLPE